MTDKTLDPKYSNNQVNKGGLLSIIIISLVTIPIFFTNYFRNTAVEPLVLVSLTLCLFLIARDKVRIPDLWPNRILGIIFILTIVSLPLSLLVIHSVPGVLWWLAFVSAFIIPQLVIFDAKAFHKLSIALVISAVLVGLHAIYSFIGIGLTSYPRLDSLIGLHNVYSGFLLLPFMISIAFALSTQEIKKRVIWLATSAFLFSNIILTFSRGAWVSGIIAIVFVVAIFWKQLRSSLTKQIVLNTARTLIIIATIAVLISGSVWLAAKHTAKQQSASNTTVDIFSGENKNENAFTSRLGYFHDAWNVFTHNPVFGFGPGNYADALNNIKTNPSFFASDPHNFFLKQLAEQGLIETLLFIVFLVIVLFSICRSLRDTKPKRPLIYTAVFVGLIASLIHICMDVDWKSPALTVIFMIFAGALYASTNDNSAILNKLQNKLLPTWVTYLCLLLLSTASIVSLWLFLADNARQDGDFFFENKRFSQALVQYDNSIAKNPYEPQSWYKRSELYLVMKESSHAEQDIDQAILLNPKVSDYYSTAAQIALANKSSTSTYEKYLKLAIAYGPAKDLTNYVALTRLYISQNKNDLARQLMDSVESTYKQYRNSLWFKNDPMWQSISIDLALFKFYRASIKN